MGHSPQATSGNAGDAITWLLESPEPAVRLLTRRDILDEDLDVPRGDDVLDGAWMKALLSGQQADGGFGVHAYHKWSGAHWRLVSLVELGIPAGEPRAKRAASTVLDWLTSTKHRASTPTINGLARRHASQEGNALAVCSRLGLASDSRVKSLAESLIGWQWPDGGWNCDRDPAAHRSSFHESLPPTWGLFEYWLASGSAEARDAALRAAELFLQHRLFRNLRTGAVIKDAWLSLHYPPYWHYEILQALLVLSRLGLVTDVRCADALDIVERRRRTDGLWHPGAYWWKAPAAASGQPDPVDWGRSGPNQMLTLNALRVLKLSQRLDAADHPARPAAADCGT